MKVLLKRQNDKIAEELTVNFIEAKSKDGKIHNLLPTQIQKFIFEPEDSSRDDLKDYEIARKGLLSLCYKTFIGKEAEKDDIEISQWSDNNYQQRWTIASFRKYYEDDELICYSIESCGDRLNGDIDWKDFGYLIKEGYKYLKIISKEDD